jgi:hypothetical protein
MVEPTGSIIYYVVRRYILALELTYRIRFVVGFPELCEIMSGVGDQNPMRGNSLCGVSD